MLVGRASEFIATATPARKQLIAAVNAPFLSAVSTALSQVARSGNRLARRRTMQKTRRNAERRTSSSLLTAGRAQRDVYCGNLMAACGTDASWRMRITGTCVAVITPTELADSLDAMASEGRALLREQTEQSRKSFLDAQYLAKITSYARTLREAGAASEGVASKLGEQKGDLDWWEGVCMWFLATLVSVFERAHKVDAAIPRLVPVALRSRLSPGSTRKKLAPPPADPVTPR